MWVLWVTVSLPKIFVRSEARFMRPNEFRRSRALRRWFMSSDIMMVVVLLELILIGRAFLLLLFGG